MRSRRGGLTDLDRSKVGRVVLLYLVAAVTWIVVSGPAAAWVADRTDVSLLTLEIAKGLGFVVVTAAVLHTALRTWAGRVEAAALAERRAADRLRQAETERTAFLNSVSHELRTPLTSIVGYSQTVQRLARTEGSQRIPELTDRLVVNAERLEWLVLDLLETGTLMNGVHTARRRRVEIGALVERILGATDLGERTVEARGAPLEIDVDVAKLERCLQLILDNVTRHTPEEAHVIVSWADGDGAMDLTVDDDGPGLPERLTDHVFAPFVQGELATDQASPGIGVGLTLVEQYVRLHGGETTAANLPEGGTRIRMRLPREPEVDAPR